MFGFYALFSENGLSFWEKLAAWYEESVINELLTYLTERYFSVEFGVYENFSVQSGLGNTVRNIILALALGLMVASVMTVYTRQGLGGFVRKLLKEDCLSPDRAKTLMELGYFRSSMIRRALSRGSALGMVVRRCEEEENNAIQKNSAQANEKTYKHGYHEKPTEKIDFLTARFYIPEDLRYRAEIRFDPKGSGWVQVVFTVVLSVVLAAVLCWLLPDVLTLADNLITLLAP